MAKEKVAIEQNEKMEEMTGIKIYNCSAYYNNEKI